MNRGLLSVTAYNFHKTTLFILVLLNVCTTKVNSQCPNNPYYPFGPQYDVTSKQDFTPGCFRYAINYANSQNVSAIIQIWVDTIFLNYDLPAVTCDSLWINGALTVIDAQSLAHDTIINIQAPHSCLSSNLYGLQIINIAGQTYTVTNTNDNGPGSLREQISRASYSTSPDNIYFNIPGIAPHVIQPLTPLPSVLNSVNFDATTQPANGYTGSTPKIELNGSICGGTGLAFYGNSAYNPNNNANIFGCYIYDFNYGLISALYSTFTCGAPNKGNVISGNSYGFQIDGINELLFENNFVGTKVNGDSAFGNLIEGGHAGADNIIFRNNLISGNAKGVTIHGGFATIISNKFGTDKTGSYAVPNFNLALSCLADSAIIGGYTYTNDGNLFSGNYTNTYDEVLDCQGSEYLVIKGNKFGTNISGTDTIPNRGTYAIRIFGCNNAEIGGNSIYDHNIICPTINSVGLYILFSTNAIVKNNYFGVYPNGNLVPENGGIGILTEYIPDSTTIANNTLSGFDAAVATTYNHPSSHKKISVVNNTIYQNPGVAVVNNWKCFVSQNSIYDNGLGIQNNYYGIANPPYPNDSIIPPLINIVYADSVLGTSRPNAAIELYYSQSLNGTPQGKTYIATVTADTNGNWKFTGTINLSKSVTATQTDSGKYTSEFASMITNVWPGDCNYDLVVNNLDFLYLNIATGDTGAVRNNASLNWTAQPCHNWSNSFPSGINHKHADTDGNGIVNINDTLAITQNYNLTHPAKPLLNYYNNSLPDLKIVIENDTVSSDSLITLKIFAGDSLFPIDSIYGIKFSVLFNPALIDTTMVYYDFSQSGLGMLHSDLESFQKSSFTSGKIDIALCRTNHTDTTNFSGLLGIIKLKPKNFVPPMSLLQVALTDIAGITHSENLFDFNALADSVVLFRCQNLATFIANQPTYCYGDLMSASVYLLYPAQPLWYIDSVFISNNLSLSTDTLSIGAHQLDLTVSNAYCNLEFNSSIVVNGLPTVQLGNDTSTCNIPITIDGGAGFSTYQWNNGETTQSIIVNVTSNYAVVVTDNNGCSNADTVAIIINANPTQPVISQNLSLLTSSCSIGNQWLMNGVNIPGAIYNTYNVTLTGWYSVMVTDSNGCTNMSDSVYMDLTEVNDIANSHNNIRIVPNPAGTSFEVWGLKFEVNDIIIITDALGKIVYQQKIGQPTSILKFQSSNYLSGIYFVNVKTSKFNVVLKLIKY